MNRLRHFTLPRGIPFKRCAAGAFLFLALGAGGPTERMNVAELRRLNDRALPKIEEALRESEANRDRAMLWLWRSYRLTILEQNALIERHQKLQAAARSPQKKFGDMEVEAGLDHIEYLIHALEIRRKTLHEQIGKELKGNNSTP